MLDRPELARLTDATRKVPLTTNEYNATDFVAAVVETVMDYRNNTTTVERAGRYFEEHAHRRITTLDDLEDELARYPDDRDGNDALAIELWNYHHWRRAQELRGLAAYFGERDVTDLASLRAWAEGSTSKDFVGHIKGLGPTVYQWLVMRAGVETIKPDVHVLRFVSGAVGRPVNGAEAVQALEVVAERPEISPRVPDWSVWEYQRAGS